MVPEIQSSNGNDENEIIRQLREKFKEAKRSEKVQILTVLPRSWSISNVQDEFGVSNGMVRKAKDLNCYKEGDFVNTKSKTRPCSGNRNHTDLVQSFYECDEFSWMLPGKFASVKQ